MFTRVHCVGVGGIGVSAVAVFFARQGARVTGSDVAASEIIERVSREGVHIHIGAHSASHVPPDAELVVYSPAVQRDNEELLFANAKHIRVVSYPECLAMLMEGHVRVVVSGTHGKSTTTAMIGCILADAGLDPSVVVGSLVPQFKGNVRIGKGLPFVIEGDEYRKSFHAYTPDILVLTNIEPDHLDVYRNIEDIANAFSHVVRSMPASGVVIAQASDERVKKVLQGIPQRIRWYGPGTGNALLEYALAVPGEHNVQNALAAREAARELGVSDEKIRGTLESFGGIWRRFETKARINGVTVIDDYAHHPTEIRATLRAAKQQFPRSRIICVFQPHQRHRTHALFSEFVSSFADADVVVLTNAYSVAGRDEQFSETSEDLAKAITQPHDVQFVADMKNIPDKIADEVRYGDVVIMMGAGTIYEMTDSVMKKIRQIKKA